MEGGEGGEGGAGVRPALGMAWADTLTTRLMLYRDEAVEDSDFQQVHVT